MESSTVGQAKNGNKTQPPISNPPKSIVESEYIKINGPFITISSFAVTDWQDSNSITIKNMTVKTIEEAREEVKKVLYGSVTSDVKIYSAGIEVDNLGSFCTDVVSAKGNALFTVMRS